MVSALAGFGLQRGSLIQSRFVGGAASSDVRSRTAVVPCSCCSLHSKLHDAPVSVVIVRHFFLENGRPRNRGQEDLEHTKIRVLALHQLHACCAHASGVLLTLTSALV